jgi:hypothetical protein
VARVGEPAWLNIALEEYKALRAEILTTMQTQQSTLTIGTAALGVIAAGAFNLWKEAFVATILFLFVAPFLSKLVLTIWIGEVTRMMRAGRYLHEFETAVHREMPEFPDWVMKWETRLREADPASPITRWERHYEWNYLAIILMYWSIGVASIVLGAWRAAHGGLDWSDQTIVSVALLTAAASLVGLVLILRQLAIVCDTKGVLKFLKRLQRKPRQAPAPPQPSV